MSSVDAEAQAIERVERIARGLEAVSSEGKALAEVVAEGRKVAAELHAAALRLEIAAKAVEQAKTPEAGLLEQLVDEVGDLRRTVEAGAAGTTEAAAAVAEEARQGMEEMALRVEAMLGEVRDRLDAAEAAAIRREAREEEIQGRRRAAAGAARGRRRWWRPWG